MNDRSGDFIDFVYNVNKLNMVFALSSVALMIVTLWMIWDDYDREWKVLQRESMAMETYKTEVELQAAQKAIDQDELKSIQEGIDRIEASIQAQQARYDEAVNALEDLRGTFYLADQNVKFEKAYYDVTRYQYEEAVHQGHDATEKKAELDGRLQKIEEYQLKLEEVQAEQAKWQKIVDEVGGEKIALERKRNGLFRTAETLEKKLVGIEVNFANTFRNAPLLDFMRPSIKIQQIVLGDLRNELNFMQIPKVDRCTTCHLNIDQRGYELDPETGLFQNEVLKKFVQETFPESDWKSKSKVFSAHPNLDLYLHSASAHPIDEVGCTTCHLGRDRGVTFVNTAHVPDDKAEAKVWEEKYHWHKMHYWDYPQRPTRYLEATCADCHQGVVDIPEATELNRGWHLISTLGCHGCHKVALPRFEGLRKVGPDLRKIASKVDQDWALKWIRDPKGFRPTTKMPKFFDLPNVNSAEDIARNTAVIQGITAYLFDKSETVRYPDPPPGNVARGEVLASKTGCRGCHVVGADDNLGQEYGYRNFGPNLNEVGSKLSAGWLYHWLKDPTAYFPDTVMPNLRLTDQEAADITAYLLTLKNPDFEIRTAARADAKTRDDLILSNLRERLPLTQARARLNEMSDQGRDLYLGEQYIARQGCFGCHLISGFENVTPIGTELTLEGSKAVAKLDFGMNTLHLDHNNYDWFFAKLKQPRVFDEGKVKMFKDKLRMPDFGLPDADIEAITTALLSFSLTNVAISAKDNLTPHEVEIEKGRRLVYERNCRGCHEVEGKGAAIRPALAKAYGKLDGMSEADAMAFSPPILNGEGKKVQPDWFFSFLKNVVPIRPWLDVRMPTFGFSDQEAIDAVTYFSRLDEQQFPYETFVHKTLSANEIRGGVKIFSPDIFNCWTCHQQGEIKPKGDPASWAPDLKLSRERLKEEWIKQWLWDPQKLMPGTKMPTFFGDQMVYLPEDMAPYLTLPEGVKPEDGILEVPTDSVIQSITDYIIHGLHQDTRLSQR
ncbi:MAG: c-type cytochrome [bacterium]|nr:c-type cytochrome [bacterium]